MIEITPAHINRLIELEVAVQYDEPPSKFADMPPISIISKWML
ncbi:MAG: hypothetical protein U9Q82_11695 [Chloroflexota bacterium]|nr:hypothetical protein [Chloroflexota bacterium]